MLVVDDPHSVDQAASDTERHAAVEWWNGSMATRLNDLSSAMGGGGRTRGDGRRRHAQMHPRCTPNPPQRHPKRPKNPVYRHKRTESPVIPPENTTTPVWYLARRQVTVILES